ncbi:MAG TPA: DUF2846 domain-containing protein [Candidatus Acidoferrum sp.]|nr:DUF2846 domain-containing protein [Candidatus Acidoferrum sp.]
MRSFLFGCFALALFLPATAYAQVDTTGGPACGPDSEKFKTSTDKNSHPEPQVVADKAVVVVVRPTMLGNKVQTKFAVDGKWVGVNRGDNYFIFAVAPGTRQLCSQAENDAKVILNAEAGKIYFVQQHVKMGILKAENALEILDEEKGRAALAKCHPSSYEKK